MTSRTKRALCVLVPSALLLAWRVYSLVAGAGPAAARASATPPSATDNSARPTPPTVSVRPRQDPRWASQMKIEQMPWPRDPFSPPQPIAQDLPPASRPTTDSHDPPALNLAGISEANGRRIAILSGRLVKVGTKLEDGVEVTDITSKSVVVRRGGWEFEFRIGLAVAAARPVNQR